MHFEEYDMNGSAADQGVDVWVFGAKGEKCIPFLGGGGGGSEDLLR